MKKLISTFGYYLAKKRNFMRYAVLGISVPAWVWVTWLYLNHYRDSGIALWVVMIAIVIAAAYVWGELMWNLFFADRARRLQDQRNVKSDK